MPPGVEVDRVLTIQWCHSRDTAELLGVRPVEMPALNSFFADRSTRDAQTREARDYLAGLPQDERVILVTHQVNITALTGRGMSSGDVFAMEVGPDGAVTVLDEILIRP